MRPVILRRGLVALFAAAVSFGAIVQAQAETLRIGYQKYGTLVLLKACLLYTSPSPRDRQKSRMPSSA